MSFKCSFLKCHSKELTVEKREVFAAMFFRKEPNSQGVDEYIPDGHKWVCQFHFNFLKKIRKPLLSLLSGKRDNEKGRKRYSGFKPKKSNNAASGENGVAVQPITGEGKSELS